MGHDLLGALFDIQPHPEDGVAINHDLSSFFVQEFNLRLPNLLTY
jgi:hypothetical protein